MKVQFVLIKGLLWGETDIDIDVLSIIDYENLSPLFLIET